jgi:hypothetical protein
MLIQSEDPFFLRLNVKLKRIEAEVIKGERNLKNLGIIQEVPLEELTDMRSGLLALRIHNIYNGMEQVWEDVALRIDGEKPGGDSTHVALLEQMMASSSKRPAMIAADELAAYDDLRRFRHLFRHSYGVDMWPTEVIDKFQSIRERVWPGFLSSLERLRSHLEDEPEASECDDLTGPI